MGLEAGKCCALNAVTDLISLMQVRHHGGLFPLAVISTSGDRPNRREKVSSGETRTATVGRIDPIYSRCQYPLPGGAGEHDYVFHVNVDEYLERWKENQ